MLPLETLEEANAACLDLIEHAFERLDVPFQVGIGNIHAGHAGGTFQKRPDPGPRRRAADHPKVVEDAPVHGEDVVEAVEIRLLNLPRPKIAEIEAAPARDSLGSGIGRSADLKVAGRGAVDEDALGQAPARQQGPEATLGGRRAANVPQADD